MKKIINIVVTGGPCAGKTTALDELAKFLRLEGYAVFIVSEIATELINDGVRPFGEDKLKVSEFQLLITKAQLEKEEIRLMAARMCSNDKTAIIYDRGVLDNRAFLKEEEFQQILKELGLKEAELLARYDLVIHLVTAAIGKEEYYTTLNNSARTETAEEARMRDRATIEAWRNHPNLRIINNDTLFDGKIQKVKNAIRSFLGEEEVVEQKRYLINIEDINFDKVYSLSLFKEEIEEFVKLYDDEEDEMYVKSTIDGSSYYTKVRNRFYKDGTTIKRCRNIGFEEYYSNKASAKSKPIVKFRYNVIHEGERYRVDVYHLGKEPFVIVERDVIDKDKHELPSFIRKASDITNNRNYDDDSLCIDYNIDALMKGDKHESVVG